ncbi:hypothetical protein QYM36_014005 [Artemia franciscana]|uniref:Uncharacterized protein n=1 Tax=Artemia franciscana TaxID=6661 RepID=A0AA88HMG6_ARTSF|nr:hypothetical protein QYM36_014005 [Artemia franciscana]
MFYTFRDYTLSVNNRIIIGFVKHVYKTYFEVKLGKSRLVLRTADSAQDVRVIPRTVDEGCKNFTEGWDFDGLEGAVGPFVVFLLLWHKRYWHQLDESTQPQVPELPSACCLAARCEENPAPVFIELLDTETRPPVQTREDIQKRSVKHTMV